MALRIDQVGLSAGTPGVARNDGLSTGAKVTLTDTAAGGMTLFELLWVPVGDTSARASLAASNDSHVWSFTPSTGVFGPYRIRLTHTVGAIVTSEVRIFGIADDSNFVPPAPGERSDPNASLLNAIDPAVIARCERNWPTSHFPAGNPFGWGPELVEMLGSSDGGEGVSGVATALKTTDDVVTPMGGSEPAAGKILAIGEDGETMSWVSAAVLIPSDDGPAGSISHVLGANFYPGSLQDDQHWVTPLDLNLEANTSYVFSFLTTYQWRDYGVNGINIPLRFSQPPASYVASGYTMENGGVRTGSTTNPNVGAFGGGNLNLQYSPQVVPVEVRGQVTTGSQPTTLQLGMSQGGGQLGVMYAGSTSKALPV